MATQNSSTLISYIYNSRVNLIKLMKNLDYNVKDYESFTNSEVNAMFQNKQLDILLEKNQEDAKTKRKNKIYIRYYLAKTFRPQNIQEIIDDLYNLEEILTKDDTLLIITKDEPNETLVNSVKHIWEQDGIFIVIESIKRLQYYILDHILVPPHRILTDEETSLVKMKYNISDNFQLPEISRFDPVALAICIRPGQICEIIRPSKTAIQAKYYRICV
jgi:DNA-directed RNA polymerase subunit H (RpoH/RPB5)